MNVLIAALGGLLVGWLLIQAVKIMWREMTGFSKLDNHKKKKVQVEDWRTISRAMMRNRDHLIFHKNGAIEVDVDKMLRHPKVQSDIRAAARLYKAMVIKSLLTGEKPPRQHGDFLPMNKERLLAEWDNDWQEVLDDLGLDYNQFFGIREELTAEEIASQYVEKERTSKGTIRGYARSNRSLRL